jgi:MSHA biogenesis protein MshM
MYLYHFGVKELPFTLTPNTQFFFGLPTHKEALSVLQTALTTGEGFIKVTGEVGTGKTLVCRKLLKEMPDSFVTAYIPNPLLSPSELRHAVATELEVELDPESDQQEFTQAIQKKLVDIRMSGRAAVLVIDEAQALPDESIEALRLMTNLETESSKLMQVILFGQPELNEKIARPELRQLRQRITFSYELSQMNADQVYQYANYRMKMAGNQSKHDIFPQVVCKKLFQATKGTPRLVNVVCHKALMLAFGEGLFQVSKSHIQHAISDTEAVTKNVRSPWFTWAIPGLVITSLLTTFLIFQSDTAVIYRDVLSMVSGWR